MNMSKNALIALLVLVLIVVVGFLVFYKVPKPVIVNSPTDSSTYNTITPPAVAPSVKTEDATGVLRLAAKLNGSVNPNGPDTTYWFEFGETTDLGKVTATESAGIGTAEIKVTSPATALESNIKYYFRVAAQNRFGTVYGNILSFTTK